ncbi:hypothetical protein ACSQ67_005925 [Phaseolus vulgaris]
MQSKFKYVQCHLQINETKSLTLFLTSSFLFYYLIISVSRNFKHYSITRQIHPRKHSVLSPLVPASSLGSSKGEDRSEKVVTKPEKVQAILKGIKRGLRCISVFMIVCFWFSCMRSWYSFIKSMFGRLEQSPKKVNLVVAPVRGMLVKDALMQLGIDNKTSSKSCLSSSNTSHSFSRANASHNHGLDPNVS